MAKNKYKYMLVQNALWYGDGTYSVESKELLRILAAINTYTVICDDQPLKMLKSMLKLLEES